MNTDDSSNNTSPQSFIYTVPSVRLFVYGSIYNLVHLVRNTQANKGENMCLLLEAKDEEMDKEYEIGDWVWETENKEKGERVVERSNNVSGERRGWEKKGDKEQDTERREEKRERYLRGEKRGTERKADGQTVVAVY